MAALPPRPATLSSAPGGLLTGCWAGVMDLDPVTLGRRRGRARRWSYSAFAQPGLAVGAAVVDLGAVIASFAWVAADGRVVTWERKGLGGRSGRCGRGAGEESRFAGRGDRVTVGGDGALDIDVGTDAGRLRVRTEVAAGTPALICTPTPHGGWNATQKAAGEIVRGTASLPGGAEVGIDALSWRDLTAGRQDRHTTWLWAAGAGHGQGRRVGLNCSTGMNGTGPGEDVVWWDDVPYALAVTTLGPSDEDPRGPWEVGGPGWSLRFAPKGVRAADENLLVIRSRYVQPIGTFAGTLPGPDGTPIEVTLDGVTEDHLAVW